MAEARTPTIAGRAQFGSKRDAWDFVAGMRGRTGDKYVFQYRKVIMEDDDGREHTIWELEWFEP